MISAENKAKIRRLHHAVAAHHPRALGGQRVAHVGPPHPRLRFALRLLLILLDRHGHGLRGRVANDLRATTAQQQHKHTDTKASGKLFHHGEPQG